jgi:hypothetical protein
MSWFLLLHYMKRKLVQSNRISEGDVARVTWRQKHGFFQTFIHNPPIEKPISKHHQRFQAETKWAKSRQNVFIVGLWRRGRQDRNYLKMSERVLPQSEEYLEKTLRTLFFLSLFSLPRARFLSHGSSTQYLLRVQVKRIQSFQSWRNDRQLLRKIFFINSQRLLSLIISFHLTEFLFQKKQKKKKKKSKSAKRRSFNLRFQVCVGGLEIM